MFLWLHGLVFVVYGVFIFILFICLSVEWTPVKLQKPIKENKTKQDTPEHYVEDLNT